MNALLLLFALASQPDEEIIGAYIAPLVWPDGATHRSIFNLPAKTWTYYYFDKGGKCWGAYVQVTAGDERYQWYPASEFKK